jgi:hypothetical protein
MSTYARDTHRQLDRAYAESEARDTNHGFSQSYDRTDVSHVKDQPGDIARPRRWRQDNVSGNRPREPRVLVLKLRQRTSERGNIYLDGWMGQAKLLGFKEAERDEYGNEVWSIYAVTPTSKGDRT